jgi:dihydroxyacetone kinase-like protein
VAHRPPGPDTGEQSQTASGTIDVAALADWLRAFAAAVGAHADELTTLDAAIGDGDHGINLNRGMTSVVTTLDDLDPAATAPARLLKSVGMKLVSTVGGASGPLYGTFFLRMASASGDRTVLDAVAFAAALRAGLDGVASRGKSERGDKTMLDALGPACDGLDAALVAGEPLPAALAEAAHAAERGRDRTFPMVARKGRASYLGPRSAGHLDPGAASAALLVRAAAQTLGGTTAPDD